MEVQRKRSLGFKLPANTICVNRPLKYGNVYKVVNGGIYGYNSLSKEWVFIEVADDNREVAASRAIALFDEYIHGRPHLLIPCPYTVEDIKRELKGKNLACFCPVGSPCHRQILIKIANGA